MLPGLDDAATETALRRLGAEEEIWITTVRADGQPQTSPVGFLWDGAEADRYVAKYGAIMELVGITRDEFLGDYSTVIRVTPTRVRAY